MSRPLVSIIIPVYQGSDLIRQSVASALAQSWPEIEVIVVDDGSTDDTAAVVESVLDSRVKLVRQANSGASSARNRGLAESRGAWIQFLDHDDILSPNKIESQMHRLLGEGGDCIACCTWQRFDQAPSDTPIHRERLWRDDSPLDWLLSARGGDGMMPTGTWLTPRATIERSGTWDVSLPGSLDDDGEFFSRAVLASRRVLFCGDAVLHYRNAGSANLRNARSERHVRALLMTQRLYEERFLAREDSARVRRSLAHGYAAFLEMIYPDHPAFCKEAFSSISRLGGEFKTPGSKPFARLVSALGLRRALQVRRCLRWMFGRPLLGGKFLPAAYRRRTGM